jgi:hypothetical protein
MNTTESDAMERPVAAAVQIVEARCGPIGDTEWTYLVELDSSGALLLPSGPLGSVDALLDPSGVDRVDDLAVTSVSWKFGIVWPPTRTRGTWAVTVTTHRATGTDDLVEAAVVIAKQLWSPRRGEEVRPQQLAMGSPMAMAMGGTSTVGIPVPAGFAIPARALELMGDHLLPMVG